MSNVIRIIGIDPGLRNTGWGMIDAEGQKLKFIACGTVQSEAKDDLATRLKSLYNGLDDVIKTYDPREAAVESTFVNKDAVATLKLGQARGIAMVVPALAGMVVAEYAPNMVKKSVVGAGHADKDQVLMMVKMLLPKAVIKSEHAADALAIAICHAHHRQMSAASLGARMRISA